MVTVPRPALTAQLGGLLRALESHLGADARASLRHSTLGVLRAWPQVRVAIGEAATGRSGCEVAGAFLSSTTPPTLVVAQALSAGREAFTALHELAHLLQATTDSLGDRLVTQPDGGFALEEAACDAFAAEILIPADVAAAHLAGGATAGRVRDLWLATAPASRSAVCVAASRHLSAPGHVTLLDRDGCVLIDATAGEPRAAKGTDLSAAPLVARALTAAGGRATGRLQYAYGDAWTGPELYAQVGELDGYSVVVAVTDHAPWASFSPTAQSGPSPRWWSCESCPNEFPVPGNTCERCGQPKCPDCGACGCALRARTCTECFLLQPAAMFVGTSTVCNDCTP